MALTKVCGIETEYGIVVRGGDNNPVSASSMLINAYVAATNRQRGRIGWDFEDEQPAQRRPRLLARRVARARGRDPCSSTPCSPTAPATTSTTPTRRSRLPRCTDCPRGARVGPCRRGDRAGIDGRTSARCCPTGGEIIVHKNNSDGKGNSYGCHENYLIAREVPFGRIVEPDHVALRDPPGVLRGGQGRLRTPGSPRRSRAVPAQPACRLLRGGDRARDHAEAPDRQHPRRAARRRPEVPPPPRDRRRRQHERGRHLPEGGHDGRSCWR